MGCWAGLRFVVKVTVLACIILSFYCPLFDLCVPQGKILDLTGKSKDKESKAEKKESKGRSKKNSLSSACGAVGGAGSDEMDSSEADLVAILANQVVKDEIKKMKGFKSRKKGGKTVIKKKISKAELFI